MRQVHAGNVTLYPHRDARPRREGRRTAGIVCRDLVTGEVFSMSGHAVVLATGGYGNAFYLSTNAKNSQRHRRVARRKKGAYFANPCYTQIHPTCIPASDDFQSKLTLMSESLRNDGRVWVPKQMDDTALARPDPRGRARLLPRAPLPRVRQPRAARRRVARDQARGRRRAAASGR
jgi:succinate dehydrogenase / fumarate reductase flavoprotein subunit